MFYVFQKTAIVRIIVFALLVAVLATTAAVGGAAEVWTGNSERKIPVYKVETDKKVIALTFDAAWGADKTLKILEILNEYDAKATFFLVGFWIDSFPEETKKIAESGMEIGNHSDNHLKMSELNAEQINKEIMSVNERIKSLTGITPVYFRPPFGDYDNLLISEVESLNMVPVQWSIDSLDWKGLSGAEIADRVLARDTCGGIVLFHNNSDHILEALPLVLLGLKNKGYSFVGLNELVYTQEYYVDSQGVQHLSISY